MKTVAQLPPIEHTGEENPKKKELKKACEDFESIIAGYLFKSMRETVPQSEDEEDGQAKEVYQSMFDQTIAKELSHRPGLGLARSLYRQLEPLIKDAKPNLKSPRPSSDRLVGEIDTAAVDKGGYAHNVKPAAAGSKAGEPEGIVATELQRGTGGEELLKGRN